MFTQGRITSGVISGLTEFMRGEGLDLPLLASRIGFDPYAQAHHESGFIPFDAFLWLLERGAQETGDDSFALRFAELHHLDATGLVYYITENAPNLREVFRARVRFARIVASGYSVTLQEEDERAMFSWIFPEEMHKHSQFMDYAATLTVQRIRHLLGREWRPTGICLQHAPPRSLEHFHRLFGENISFGDQPTAIETDRSSLDKPVLRANSKLLRELERGAAAIISSPAGQDFLQRASVAISGQLAHGMPTIDEVARSLAMSRRTLQRRLSDNETSFRDLVDLVQANMARHLLMETDLPLIEIALLLGFAESSSFSRAARQWLGEPPIEFRQKNRVR